MSLASPSLHAAPKQKQDMCVSLCVYICVLQSDSERCICLVKPSRWWINDHCLNYINKPQPQPSRNL